MAGADDHAIDVDGDRLPARRETTVLHRYGAPPRTMSK
jgi:hypothetical protein